MTSNCTFDTNDRYVVIITQLTAITYIFIFCTNICTNHNHFVGTFRGYFTYNPPPKHIPDPMVMMDIEMKLKDTRRNASASTGQIIADRCHLLSPGVQAYLT